MKRSVCSLLALASVGLILAGCTETSSSSTTTGSGEEITLTWWNDYAQTGDSATTQRYDYVQSVIEAFKTDHPNIHVVQENHNSYGEIAGDVTNALSAGGRNLPNIASVYPDNAVIWDETEGAVLHPEQYFEDPEIGFGDTYADIQSSIEAEKSGYGSGPLLTLPYSRSSEAMFINETVFDKVGEGACGNDSDPAVMGDLEKYTAPIAASTKVAYDVPTTWTEMIDLARQMKADFPEVFANQRDSQNMLKAVPICYDSGDNMFITFCKMMGIPYTDEASVLFNNDDAKQMMIQLKKWNNEGLIGTADQLPITNAEEGWHEYSTSMVNYGKVFILISSTTSGMYLGVDGYRAGVYQTPTIGGRDLEDATFSSSVSQTGEHYAISQGPSLVLFEGGDEAINRATFEFYTFLTNTENGAGLSNTTGYFPVRASSNDTEELREIIDAADDTITDKSNSEADLTAKTNHYKGCSYQINEEYISQNDYFIATINDKSAATRSAVGTMVNTIFDTVATTDSEIETLVNNAFQTAYLASIQ